MKKWVFPLLLVLWSELGIAQTRNLSYYLEQAKQNSPVLQTNTNQQKLIDLDLMQIKRVLAKPEIVFESSVLLAPIIEHNSFQLVSEGADSYQGFDLSATDGGQYQALISLKQGLLTGSKFQAYKNKAAIDHQLAENIASLTVHELEQLVSYQYVLCLKSKLQIDNGQAVIKLLDERLMVLQTLIENGIYKQTDLMLLRIEHQDFELELNRSKADFETNLLDLNLICGIHESNVVELELIDIPLVSTRLESSRFLNAYQFDSLKIASDLQISELKYKPQLNFFVNTGLNAVYLPNLNRLGLSTGLTFSMTIYDGNQRKIEREKSIIQLNSVAIEKQNFQTQAFLSTSKSMAKLKSINQQLGIVDDQITQYEKLSSAYNSELSQGEASVMDLKNLLKDIQAKKNESLLLQMEKQALVVAVNYWNY